MSTTYDMDKAAGGMVFLLTRHSDVPDNGQNIASGGRVFFAPTAYNDAVVPVVAAVRPQMFFVL